MHTMGIPEKIKAIQDEMSKTQINKATEKKFDHYCGDDVYVLVNKELEKNPEIAKKCAHILKMMEDPNTEEAKMAEKITRRVFDAQLQNAGHCR